MVVRTFASAGWYLLRAGLIATTTFICSLSLNFPAQADYGKAISALRGTNSLPADFRRAERLLRACAWQDSEILCQVALGDLYWLGVYPNLGTSYSRPMRDHSEALAWYFIALATLESQDRGFRFGTHYGAFKKRIESGCRITFDNSDEDIRKGAKERIEYIYRSRGASGWFQLGEIYKKRPRNSCGALTGTNKHLARMHFEEARQLGHPFAADEISNIDRSLGYDRSDALAGSYSHRLLYPPFKLNKPANKDVSYGVLQAKYLTDESETQLENEPNLNLLELQKAHAKAWLAKTALLEIYPEPPSSPIRAKISEFRKDLNIREHKKLPHPMSPWEIVLALKLAANDGGTESANALGEMYFNGIGVPLDMERARYAFEIAAFKGSALNRTNDELSEQDKAIADLKSKIVALEHRIDTATRDDTANGTPTELREEKREKHRELSKKEKDRTLLKSESSSGYSQVALSRVREKAKISKAARQSGEPECDPENVNCVIASDINYNAVKNLCLVLADDTRFPNHRVLANLYMEILTEGKEEDYWKPGASLKTIKECKTKLGL